MSMSQSFRSLKASTHVGSGLSEQVLIQVTTHFKQLQVKSKVCHERFKSSLMSTKASPGQVNFQVISNYIQSSHFRQVQVPSPLSPALSQVTGLHKWKASQAESLFHSTVTLNVKMTLDMTSWLSLQICYLLRQNDCNTSTTAKWRLQTISDSEALFVKESINYFA